MEDDPLITETESSMAKAVEYMTHEFASVRTGKAAPALVENIDVKVQTYGSTMKLKQLAMIRAPEARLIVVEPYDPGTVADIERGIRESKLGINPSVDGKAIRLPIPELSEERRRDLAKMVKSVGEDTRVRVRACRKDGMDMAKAMQKDGEITEDDLRLLEKEIQGLTDRHVKAIDEKVKAKEDEIMTV